MADKSAQKTCLLGTDGRQIVPLDSTIVPQMADKSAILIVHARHKWPINRPRDYQPWKDENLCLSIHTTRNWVCWLSALRILYIHLPCTVDRGGASILSLGNVSTKGESPCQTVRWKNELCARWRYVENYLHANWRIAKKTDRVNITITIR